jgi:hypothetical protein
VKRSDLGSSVEDRLRMALDVDLSEIREGVDMSPRAVTQRLVELGEISSLCLALGPKRDR